jgi:hypothetical protein
MLPGSTANDVQLAANLPRPPRFPRRPSASCGIRKTAAIADWPSIETASTRLSWCSREKAVADIHHLAAGKYLRSTPQRWIGVRTTGAFEWRAISDGCQRRADASGEPNMEGALAAVACGPRRDTRDVASHLAILVPSPWKFIAHIAPAPCRGIAG